MRTLFLALMMMILPLHFSWSAASEYCQHEEGAAAIQHFGHHFHQHHASTHKKEADHSPVKKAFHQDCGFCHVSHGVSELPRGLSMLIGYKALALSPPDFSFLYSSHIPQQPERPNWTLAS